MWGPLESLYISTVKMVMSYSQNVLADLIIQPYGGLQ